MRPSRPALIVAALVAAVSLLVPQTAGAAKRRPKGIVFLPNPVVALKDQTLTDQRDADYPELQAAYRVVRIRNLDKSGYLRGDYADVCAVKCAYSKRLRFFYDRSDRRFEQVNAYVAVTRAQRYIQKLGFDDINNEPQKVTIRAGQDNSFYDSKKDVLLFGYGGVDDAEDMEVVWHEYGHAIMDDQVPGFGTSVDAQAIGEGFGDYWAFTMSVPVSDGYDPACIADWDSVSFTTEEPHCLRRVDLDLTVSDRNGSPHHDGQIWSRALYDIHLALGREAADRIILAAQFSFAKDTTLQDAADAVVASAKAYGGKPAGRAARSAFRARGILE